MKICDDGHDEVVYQINTCPVCETKDEIKRHELYQEKLLAANRELMRVVSLAVESQSWTANDPNEDRWKEFYSKCRDAVRNGY